jgi:hypothetical protein
MTTACAGHSPSPPPVPSAPSARVGAYYFDGWSGSLRTGSFHGLVGTPFADRRPLSGWQDGGQAEIEQQLQWAHWDGLQFFVFDWYAHAGDDPALNAALQTYRSLSDHHGIGYALFVVTTPGLGPTAGEWPSIVEHVASTDFKNPDYARVDGKPLLVIQDTRQFAGAFGGTAGASRALGVLRLVASNQGLPGVFTAGGVDTGGSPSDFAHASVTGVPYDALTAYSMVNAYAAQVRGPQRSPLPYDDLAAVTRATWDGIARNSPLPYIPSVPAGWDPRPWGEKVSGRLFWFTRSAQEVAGLVRDGVTWVTTNPRMRVGEPPDPPLLLIEAWNELGEGAFIVPTVGDGNRYGQALHHALSD